MIDRAIELGLHERDPQMRNQLASAMIDFLVRRAEDDASGASERELREFYAAEQFRFERAAQYRLAVEGAAVPLPDGFLLEKEIAQRLGPSVAQQVVGLNVGESLAAGDGAYTVQLVERRGGDVASFEEAREAVEAAYLRRRGELAVRDFLELARQRTSIVVELD